MLLALIGWIGFAGLAMAATAPKKPAGPPIPTLRTNNLAPLPAGQKAAISHSAFEDGDCSICHKNKDAKDPGPLKGPVNALCLDCHEEKDLAKVKAHLDAPKKNCIECHDPHLGADKFLLKPPVKTSSTAAPK